MAKPRPGQKPGAVDPPQQPQTPEFMPAAPGKFNKAKLLNTLDDVDRQIIQLKYENRGLSYSQLGKLLEPPISKQAVNQRILKHGLTDVLAALEVDVIAAFQSHQHAAVGVIANTMNGTNKSYLAFEAARFFLSSLSGSKAALPAPVEVTDLVFFDPNEPKGAK